MDRLNITLPRDLIKDAKAYAKTKHTSLSKLIDNLLRATIEKEEVSVAEKVRRINSRPGSLHNQMEGLRNGLPAVEWTDEEYEKIREEAVLAKH